MTAPHETMEDASVAGWSKASRASARSSAEHQQRILGHSRAGHARGLCCAQILAADDTQDWPVTLRAGSYVRLVTSNLLPGSISDHLRGRAIAAAPRLSHSVASRVSSTARLNTLAHHQSISRSGDVLHFHRRLSSSGPFAGFEPSEASNGRVPKSCGAFPKKKGEFPNVGC